MDGTADLCRGMSPSPKDSVMATLAGPMPTAYALDISFVRHAKTVLTQLCEATNTERPGLGDRSSGASRLLRSSSPRQELP